MVTIVFALLAAAGAAVAESPTEIFRGRFQAEVERRLELPADEQVLYAERLDAALRDAGIAGLTPQFVVLADRDPQVQAVMLYWYTAAGEAQLIGAAPASTGRPGRFDYFLTPTGVFPHTVAHPDYRAEGTRNEFGVMGLGPRGARVFDFGWQQGERGWGDGGYSRMRLLLHATDPELLEPHIGLAQSKGCIRVALDMNRFIDRYGILDADYEHALALGMKFSALDPRRQPTAWSGRYLVVVDSARSKRPAWSPPPPGIRSR